MAKIDGSARAKAESVRFVDDDCWEVIFSKLNNYQYCHDIASLCLVSKRFLSITNRLKHNLIISNLTSHLLPKLLQRFRQLKSIEIKTKANEDCNGIISQISHSGLEQFESLSIICEISQCELTNIQVFEMSCSKIFPRNGLRGLATNNKGLKKLNFSKFCPCCDDDLIALTNWFPMLEELGISGYAFPGCEPITDHGLKVIASNLEGLKKITLSHCGQITDQSLVAISSNCANLTDFEVHSCPRLTENGFEFFIRNSSKLISFLLQNNFLMQLSFQPSVQSLPIGNSVSHPRYLEGFRICSTPKPFTQAKNIVSKPFGRDSFTMYGLKMLLRASLSLKDLSVPTLWLTNELMLGICENFHGLTQIDLSYCPMLGTATFFTLTKACPLLELIKMENTNLGTYEDFDLDIYRNNQVRELKVGKNKLMNNRALTRLVSVCPNLEVLCVQSCGSRNLSNEGIARCFEVCPELLHLNVSGLNVTNFMDTHKDEIKLKLKTIEAGKTSMNDEALEAIGKRCPDLEKLGIEECNAVTEHGIKLLVSMCTKIRTISLNIFKPVSVDLLDWLVKSRPSLKEIIVPYQFVPTEEQRNLFLCDIGFLIRAEDVHGWTWRYRGFR